MPILTSKEWNKNLAKTKTKKKKKKTHSHVYPTNIKVNKSSAQETHVYK